MKQSKQDQAKRQLMREILNKKLKRLPQHRIVDLFTKDGKFKMQHVPTLRDIQKMQAGKALKVLRGCPVSHHFGESKRALSIAFPKLVDLRH